MKTKFSGKRGLGLLLSLLGLLCFSAQAVRADEGDPPSRVARISYTDGAVSFQPGGQGEWGTAQRNSTVTIGDKLWVDKDARAELQAGQAAIHLASMTALSFLNLDDNTIQMRIAEGSINFRVRELREGEVYEVDAPNLAFTVKEAGAFRIDVSEDGESSRVTVIRGSGEVSAGGQTYSIRGGERGEFNGSQDIRYSISAAPSPDSFDRWAESRDLKEDNSTSAKYVSRDTVGYSDLDDYGTWDEVPEYGHVWYPAQVDVGWAPYSYGYWSSVGPWGWTWVDYAPWGYAPFHYGRWNYIGDRWGWCPGPYYARPYWGPAFVGFYGGGGWGAGFGFGFGGGVGWFPLGFGEPFCPWYRHSFGYARNINIYNTRINNINVINSRNNFNYAYAHNVHAVTVTSRSNFAGGRAVNRGAAHVTEASLRGAQVASNNRVDATPTRQSFFGAAHANAHVATPPAAVQNRAVVARSTPAPAASHMPVRTSSASTMRPATERPGNVGNVGQGNPSTNRGPANNGTTNNRPVNNGSMTPRQHELSLDKPSSNMRPNAEGNANRGGTNNAQRPNSSSNTRSWDAQGNSTDRGRAPSGFGSNNRPTANGAPSLPARGTSMTHNDRPPWAGTGNSPNAQPSRSSNGGNYGGGNNGGNSPRSYQPPQRNNNNRPPASFNQGNPGRSYSSPRSYNPPAPRSYSSPRSSSAPSYNSAPNRGSSAPSRNYSAPSRGYSGPSGNYSAPSRGYSGGGGGGGRSYSAPAPSHSSGGGGSYHGGGGGGGGGSRGRH
jgi:hypothetical protein